MCYIQPYGDVDDETDNDFTEEEDEEELDDDSTTSDEAPEKTNSSRLIEKEEIVHRFVFFDFETVQSDVIAETKLGFEHEHRPNLCVVRVKHNSNSSQCQRLRLTFYYAVFDGKWN